MRSPIPALSRGGAALAALAAVALPTFAALAATLVGTPLSAQAPVIVGAERADVPEAVRAAVLVAELGCARCHAADAAALPPRFGPRLTDVGERVDPAWLARFVAAPHATKPGTPMPDLLGDRPETERAADASAIAAWLRTLGNDDFERNATDPEAMEEGRELFHQVGCVACHAPRDDDGHEQPLAGSIPLGDLTAKYSVESLRTFLLDPHLVRPAGRMPDFGLGPREAFALANYLTATDTGTTDTPAAAAPTADPSRGAELFRTLRCAVCHEAGTATPSEPVVPLARARRDQGCLAPADTARAPGVPRYRLTEAQRKLLNGAVGAPARPLDAEQRIVAHLAARNCVACHARGDVGGVSDDRVAWFTGEDQAMGSPGRVPPPLTATGAKLQSDWLHRTIAHGQRERRYLHTKMPAFGTALADALAPLLTATDADVVTTAPPAELPDDRDQANAVKELGRTLVGDQGMGCIACHTFAGDHAGAMEAIDLVATTGQRLRPEWFAAYIRDPQRFRPDTIMPSYFVNGKSTRPDIADGDVDAQIAGLWQYLAAGRNQRKPSGLRLPPLELTVGDEAVMLRRAVQNTGKRGISVGLPGGVSYTFDAESLALNQVWWGRFLDVGPVFRGQGSGQAHIPSRERIDLGLGPAFAVLDAPDAPWPDVPRHTREQQLLGYDLDDARRPTFRYRIAGGFEVTDRVVEARAGDRTALRRTLTIGGDGAGPVTFRIAHGPDIAATDDGTFRIGDRGVVRVTGARPTIAAFEDRRELRATLTPKTELTIEYRFQETDR